VNQVELAWVAVAGALPIAVVSPWIWRRIRGKGGSTGPTVDACRAAFEQSPNGILLVDAETLRIVDANPTLLRTLGYTLEEILPLDLSRVFTDQSDSSEALLRKLRDPNPRLPFQIGQLHKSGALLNVEIRGQRLDLPQGQILALTTDDVTVRRKVEAQLLEKQQHLDHLAHHDQLTGLPNRHFLQAHLPTAIEEARDTATIMAVLFLDLDRFKHINDTRGHETGDKLLKAVAERIRSVVRIEDVVVRMGGDEFIVVLKSVRGSEQVNETAGRINEVLSAPVPVDGRPLVTTVSIGVSLYPRDGTNMGELLRHSDTAMYQAKDRGRNNFQLFSPGMDRKLKERMAIETSLRNALQRKQLDVFYQPIIDLQTNRVVGLESLLRWKVPGQGYISPEKFIAVAEDTGLIVPIGDIVLARAFEDMARWRDGEHPPLHAAVGADRERRV
jgi:diguanylate cyclase (GGDEF)-like protein/PAS domain S-box-containing protein